MEIRRIVARNLRRIRLERGISQEGVAFEAEIDRAYMSGLERGVKNPTVLLLDRIAHVLKVTVSDITNPKTATASPIANLPRGRHVTRKRKASSKL